ncbi:GNAT family N-acetyltransferase [Saccharibacillus sp. CPCC 101409]|uniref:GNAT family N-acetyltransferase n=1 Tax=Saccharibacillus sp. CPCC 101409 TaxID=3058041 RepID=UPI0026730685|nr:GNAT family N-acetyltransferase [Saccharibacillus sp. CPCC 101409]MDO3411443.1 GNAT family N-acetyltransferase [Saccharibacillus sp. CPCC 101409]
MEYIRVNDLDDPLFAGLHRLMSEIFPPEEVLAFELWREPLRDPGIRVFVAVHAGEVVGATEYRYYPEDDIAMTDFTIIGRPGLGIGPFLAKRREADLQSLAAAAGGTLSGMFAEIYDPYRSGDHEFGGVKPMDPFVRREVLAHLGYRRLDFAYVHPSWQGDGEAVGGLDLCFLPYRETPSLPGPFVAKFLRAYYSVLEPKPAQWTEMVQALERRSGVDLLPL